MGEDAWSVFLCLAAIVGVIVGLAKAFRGDGN